MAGRFLMPEYLEELYYSDLSDVEILTKNEMLALFPLAQKGNKKAREKIVRSSARFVVSVASKYKRNDIPFSDLIAEGNLGLLIALDKFDIYKGASFLTYAVWWIRQTIEKHIEMSRVIRPPSNIYSLTKKVTRELGRDADVSEIQEILGCSKLIAENIFRNLRQERVTRLDALVDNDDGKSSSYMDTLGIHDTTENDLHLESLRKTIKNNSSTLSDKEQSVIEIMFLNQEERVLTLQEVGDRLGGISKERVRQLRGSALGKLRRKMGDQGYKDLLYASSADVFDGSKIDRSVVS